MFQAVWLEQAEGKTVASLKFIEDSQLDVGDTTLNVEWSSLNYKDALAVTGKSPVVRKFPMVPGIDFAGTVKASTGELWKPGDKVLLTGWGYGEQMFGGLSAMARVAGEKLVRLPAGLDTRTAMAMGTAGFTAQLGVMALQRHGVKPESGEILVTGAGGGVGGFAVALLAKHGYKVVAATGRAEEGDRLKRLGAADVMAREALAAPGKPMTKERWAGVIDSVGSHTLANACAATRYGGMVAACGLAQGMDFPGSVAPFILRGVTLAGIDSVYLPMPQRAAVWERLARDLDAATMNDLAATIRLDEVIPAAADLLAGKVKGRFVVKTR